MRVGVLFLYVGAVCLSIIGRATGVPADPSTSGAVPPKCTRAFELGVFTWKRLFQPCVYLCSGFPISFENEDDGTACQVPGSAKGFCLDGKCIAPSEEPTPEAAAITTTVPTAEEFSAEPLKGSEGSSPDAVTEDLEKPATQTLSTHITEEETGVEDDESQNEAVTGSEDSVSTYEDSEVVSEENKTPGTEHYKATEGEQPEESQSESATGSGDGLNTDEVLPVSENSKGSAAQDSQGAEEQQAAESDDNDAANGSGDAPDADEEVSEVSEDSKAPTSEDYNAIKEEQTKPDTVVDVEDVEDDEPAELTQEKDEEE
uniref:Putative papa 1 n=1 Tax=Amblyomma triste TaxID=251400 RepID=A0A023GEM2_AMBTT